LPLINHGHPHFGENKVQEAQEKWASIKSDFPQLKLHLIGKLQTNKVKFALPLFDYIHSLDSIKLAEKISLEQKKKNLKPKIFIQINLGKESQKSGIDEVDLEKFYRRCVTEFNLNIIGIMCLPPFDEDPTPYFKKMQNLSESLKLKEISMGMSNDYMDALKFNATYIRVGSKIFGSRS
jgi:pyridoxal phosphate enzyme (YggS family)